MRAYISLLASVLALSAVQAWSPFGSGSKVEVAAPAAAPSAEATPDPFDAHPLFDELAVPPPPPQPEAGADQTASPVPEQNIASPTPTKPLLMTAPTPQTFFNGNKPLASDPYTGSEVKLFGNKLVLRPGLFLNELLALFAVLGVALWARQTRTGTMLKAKKWTGLHLNLLETAFASVDAGQGRYLKRK